MMRNKSIYLNGVVSTYTSRLMSLIFYFFNTPLIFLTTLLCFEHRSKYLIDIRTVYVIDILSVSLKLTCR